MDEQAKLGTGNFIADLLKWGMTTADYEANRRDSTLFMKEEFRRLGHVEWCSCEECLGVLRNGRKMLAGVKP